LAGDYLNGAQKFLWAAEKICNNTQENSQEWSFQLEDPVLFLLGHAADLILKATLAKMGRIDEELFLVRKNARYSHDLVALMDYLMRHSISGQHLIIDPDFSENIKIINDNFKNHDHRYSRSFSGYPADQNERLMELTRRYGKTEKECQELEKAQREYGSIIKSSPSDIKNFLRACQTQLELT
jgi:hypothetical protein